MDELILKPLVYVLSLEHNKYYVGITYNLNVRYAQHTQDQGSKWTKLHKPTGIVEVKPEANKTDEGLITLKYMKKYGIENVRGGGYCKLDLTPNTISNIQKKIEDLTSIFT